MAIMDSDTEDNNSPEDAIGPDTTVSAAPSIATSPSPGAPTDDDPSPDPNDKSKASMDDVYAAAKKVFPTFSEDKVEDSVDQVMSAHPNWSNDQAIAYINNVVAPLIDKKALQGAVVNYKVQQMGSQSGIGNTGTLPQQQAIAAAPVTPTSGPGAGQIPLWAAGASGVRYPEQNEQMVQGAVNVAKQNLAGQQQQFAQQQSAQTGAQNNVAFQQGQQVTQPLLDPANPAAKSIADLIQRNTGIDLHGQSIMQMHATAPKAVEQIINSGGMAAYNTDMAHTAAAYDANPQGYDTAVGAANDDLNNVENKIGAMQKNNVWDQRKMTIALTAVTQPNNKEAQILAAGLDPDYLDIAHTAQVIGANYGLVSGKGTDFGTQTVMNSILNPADPIKSLEVTRAAITSARDNAKKISEENHKTGGHFMNFTPTTVDPYTGVAAQKQKATNIQNNGGVAPQTTQTTQPTTVIYTPTGQAKKVPTTDVQKYLNAGATLQPQVK